MGSLDKIRVTGGRQRRQIMIWVNAAGRRVRTIFDEAKLAGSWEEVFDGRADDGTELPSGIYFARLKVDGFEPVARKLTLLR